MLLKNEIDIECNAGDLFDFLRDFERQYPLWHPGHIACDYIKGDSLEAGSVLFCQERLDGRARKYRMRLTRVDPGVLVEYTLGPGLAGAYRVKSAGAGVRFISELRLGLELSLIAAAQDTLLRRLASGRIAALEQHLAEEGRNLKVMAEAGLLSHPRPPARVSIPCEGYYAGARCGTRSCWVPCSRPFSPGRTS